MRDFKGKTGPKVPVIEQRHRTSGTKNGGQRAKKMARLLAEVIGEAAGLGKQVIWFFYCCAFLSRL